MEDFNAINIIGPKGCGKTRTAKERFKTIIEFQDEEKRDGYLVVAETSPKLFLKNNEEAIKNPARPRAVHREPTALIIICATAPLGYTTDAGVKIVPAGCLKD